MANLPKEIKEFATKEKLEIVLSAPVPAFTQEFRSGRQGSAGGRGVWGGIPPAEPSQFLSDIFKQTPPLVRCSGPLADAVRNNVFNSSLRLRTFLNFYEKVRTGMYLVKVLKSYQWKE